MNERHGLSRHPGYYTWYSMVRRCHCKEHAKYHRYGGRGITVCDEWRDSPVAFLSWLDGTEWELGLEVDREDNNLGYFPGNCRIVNRIQQMNNTCRSKRVIFNGKEMTVREASSACGIPSSTIFKRLERGWDPSIACLKRGQI
jgi:hypothetical protein